MNFIMNINISAFDFHYSFSLLLLFLLFSALDELTRVGFHLLHPIASKDHLHHEHLHIWCSTGARALCCHNEAETIRTGLTHPMIPKGTFHYSLTGMHASII